MAMHKRGFGAALLAAVVTLAACGGGGSGDPTSVPVDADITLLFFGNSHTHNHDVPGLVQTLVAAAHTGRTVAAVTAPGLLFLDERLDHTASVELMRSRRWSAVVLQAQRYSTSGTVTYSTLEAEEWVRRARTAGAMPILFPEWPRRGVPETPRILALHESIAAHQPACVPPIPQAFDIARDSDPGLVLHAPDGNHASPAGALLAALVIAGTFTGASPERAPTVPSAGVDGATQARLRAAATEALRQTSPWTWCPGDRPAGAG